jgi:hypothetical protein
MSKLGDLLEDRYFQRVLQIYDSPRQLICFWRTFFRVREADLLYSSILLLKVKIWLKILKIILFDTTLALELSSLYF